MSLAVNYRDYWKFSRWPFGNRATSPTFVTVPSGVEADARMHVVLERLYPLAVIFGPEGVGKTACLKRYLRPQFLTPRQHLSRPIYVSMIGLQRGQLFEAIAAATFERTSRTYSVSSERTVLDTIRSQEILGLSTVIFLDDAHKASTASALDVHRLMDMSESLTVVMSATEIQNDEYRELIEGKAQLRIDLPPWELRDVEQFVHQSVANAQGNPLIFSDQSIVRLHELSQGIARHLIHLTEITLLVGAATNAEKITPNLVDQAAEEMAIPHAEEQWSV